MDEGIKILEQKNIKLTPQRIGIYKLLIKNTGHLTAEDVYDHIKKEFPTMSLATVYSVLEVFVQKNLIKEIRIDFYKSRFESRVDRHHHFFCTRCFSIFDIDIPPCPALQRNIINGHVIETLQGYFYGTCKNCMKKSHE
jgi:Fur family peroxide stress response transcriptional regulator